MQLRHFTSTLAALDTEVMLIAFVGGERARNWLGQTGVPFPMAIDPTRSVYRRYGLHVGVWRVWNPQMLWYYTRKVLRGWRLRGIQGNPHQLGGDFIIDPQGIIRFAHASRTATDRPDVALLLGALRSMTDTIPAEA